MRAEDFRRLPVPGRGVDDRLSVRCKAGAVDGAPAKRQLPEGRPARRRGAAELAHGESAQESAERQRRGCWREPASPRARPRGRERRGGCLGEMIAHASQVARQVFRRGKTLVGLLRQAPLDRPAQRGGGRGIQLGDGLRLFAQDGRQRLDAGLALEGALARGHLVENRAEGELVGTEVHRLAGRLLGRHVTDRPHHGARFGARRAGGHRRAFGRRDAALGQFGEAEVQDLHVAVLRHDQVLGLQVPVHDSRRVRRREALGDLSADIERAPNRQRPGGQEVPHRPALDELHGDPDGAVGLADVVDRHDVGVRERRSGPRLVLEPRPPARVPRRFGREDLQGDVAPEPRVLCPVDLSHPPGAERREDLVEPQTRSHGERHLRMISPALTPPRQSPPGFTGRVADWVASESQESPVTLSAETPKALHRKSVPGVSNGT